MPSSQHRQRIRWATTLALASLPIHGWSTALSTPPSDDILIGQSLGLTGPIAELAQEIAQGSQACAAAVNAAGGVHGRRLRLVALDDGYVAARTVDNVTRLIDRDRVLALLSVTGTANCEAIMPILDRTGVPLFGPGSGAQSLRQTVRRNVFHVRAGYRREAAKMVEHLVALQTTDIAVVHQTGSFGKDGLEGIEAAMQARQVKPSSVVPIAPDGSDAEAAAVALAERKPKAIILITAGRPTFAFIKAYKQLAKGAQIYCLSVMGTQGNLQALGPAGVGVVVSSVVPYPWSLSDPLAGEYQRDARRTGSDRFSFAGFEGYINARILVEALRKAGPNPTRERLIDAADSLRDLKLGALPVDLGNASRQALNHVELTIINASGRFVR